MSPAQQTQPTVGDLVRVHLGAPEGSWLWRPEFANVPLCVSYQRLARHKTLHRASGPWMLDSGAYTEVGRFGGWRTTPEQYAEAVHRYVEEVGGLAWAAPQSWMCEREVLVKTGLTIEDHVRATVASVLRLRELLAGVALVAPEIQGWTVTQRRRCWDYYEAEGIHLADEPIVGLGSVCGLQRSIPIQLFVRELAEAGIQLHTFGFKTTALIEEAQHIASSDSMAWSKQALHSPPMAGHTHRHCVSCPAYALRWYDDLIHHPVRTEPTAAVR
ncbi:hypothetical protein N8J89_16215 [Crossiella sp. CA-258035]|uniref:deazapurine DNA modification protein DpdA family protein n=1 Tax=Crossiella sp. CA-258035 TaxID=2981138 RepID=UPI0024BD25CB|nr:hypothetical protein [Crossiella sp. CA-258035]WHT22543.1 hypothetical protein N8J89_16215 [Crossiella sp. CA-258035]